MKKIAALVAALALGVTAFVAFAPEEAQAQTVCETRGGVTWCFEFPDGFPVPPSLIDLCFTLPNLCSGSPTPRPTAPPTPAPTPQPTIPPSPPFAGGLCLVGLGFCPPASSEPSQPFAPPPLLR